MRRLVAVLAVFVTLGFAAPHAQRQAAAAAEAQPSVSSANATTTPTANINAVGAGTITNADGTALAAGDLPSGCFFELTVTATTPTFALTNVAKAPMGAATTATLTNKTFQVDGTGNVFYAPLVPQGRLSLATATPVMISDQTAKTTIYYCLYTGNLVPIYDGTQFKWTVFAELTNDLTQAKKGGGSSNATATSSQGLDWESQKRRLLEQLESDYDGDEASPEIRAAQAALWHDGIALEGPDSDALKGILRDSGGKGVHFSGPGLREHGKRWADKVAAWIQSPTHRRTSGSR